MMHLHNFIWAQFSILRILMSCINVFQGQIKYFIDTCSFFFKVKLCFFPVFPVLGVQNLFSQDGIYW